MGRKPVGKTPMSDAQRQRRQRAKLRKESREAVMLAKQAKNAARAHEAPKDWTRAKSPGEPPVATPAAEIAYQIEEMLRFMPDVTKADVRDALTKGLDPRPSADPSRAY